MARSDSGTGRAAAFLRQHLTYQGDDCVMFPFSINPESGYGYLGFEGRHYRAHRLMCIWAHGEQPSPKHEVAHSCHKPACVNPNHLSWKTHQENIQDKVVRGTIKCANAYGQKGKLSADEVRQVRALAGKKTQVEIGQLVGLSESAIRAICKRKTYAHIE